MKRRDFLKYTLPAAAPVVIGGMPLKAMGMESPLIRALMAGDGTTDTDHVLVLVQMNGGNDGLNMVIPLEFYSAYNNARANVAIPENKVLKLQGYNKSGLHPAMTGIQNLYSEGKVSIIQSVGYPSPNFSHFRATDIWMSGADSTEVLNSGWMGRYLDYEYPGFPDGYPNSNDPDPLGIQVGSLTSFAFQGPGVSMGMSISDPTSFYNLINGIEDPVPNTPAGFELNYIRTIARQTQQYSTVIKEAALKATQQVAYPSDNNLADQLKIVARLIAGGLKTRVYMVNIGGFDTHSSQVNQSDVTTGDHAKLLNNVSEAIKAFMDDLKFQKVDQRVLGMTFSEFGRRIKSNGSMGTDHGAAAPLFMFGNYVESGVIGNTPGIPSGVNVNDNLPFQYDFRSVYASVLEKWFCLNSNAVQTVLLKNYQSLPIIKGSACNPGLEPQPTEDALIINSPNPFTESEGTTISFKTKGGHTSVMIIDTLGRVLKTLIDEEYSQPGTYTVQFKGTGLPTGVYYARLQNGVTQRVRTMLKVR